jgi:tetratricopeptide (TPR) repeat protein
MNRGIVLGLIVLGGLVASYWNALDNDFLWDDQHLIQENPLVHGKAGIPKMFATDIYYGASNFYRPLQVLSLHLDYRLYGLKPRGYHLTSILAHVGVAAAFLGLLRQVGVSWGVSVGLALFYAVHPIHTEAVTYVSGRADSLMALFLVLALWCYLRDRPVLSALSFALALMSKETAMSLPVVLLFHRLACGKEGKEKPRLIWALLFAGVVAAVFSLRFIALKEHAVSYGPEESGEKDRGVVEALAHNFITGGEQRIGFATRVLTSCKVLIAYLWLMVAPFDLHMERHMSWSRGMGEPATWGALLLLGVLGGVVWSLRSDRRMFFGVGFFLINWFPISNVYPINANMAEHWMYLPMMGVLIAAASGVEKARTFLKPGKGTACAAAVVWGGICIYFGHLTHDQNKHWKDALALSTYTLKHDPGNYRLLNDIGFSHQRGDRLDEAAACFEQAIKIYDGFSDGYYNLGINTFMRWEREPPEKRDPGLLQQAEALFLKSSSLDKDHVKSHVNRGVVLRLMRRFDEARACYGEALKRRPEMVEALAGLAWVELDANRPAEAERWFAQALRFDPGDPDILFGLGVACAMQEKLREAERCWEEVLRVSPSHPAAQQNLERLRRRLR